MQNMFFRCSAFARLVIFLIALVSSVVVGICYAAVDWPAQEDVQASISDYARCTSGCVRTNVVYISPTGPQNPGDDACMQKCRDEYLKQ